METNLIAHSRRQHGPAAMARRVRRALLILGGEAHRSVVIEFIARELGHDPRRIPVDVKEAVIRAFEANLRDERRRETLGFHLPFGEGSLRWGVLPA